MESNSFYNYMASFYLNNYYKAFGFKITINYNSCHIFHIFQAKNSASSFIADFQELEWELKDYY